MPATAEKLEPLSINMRRFEEPDLCTHTWLMARLQERFPHHNERSLATFLRGLFSYNTYLFLYQDTGCALFQVVNSFTLDAEPIIYERFVFCTDKDNALQQNAAAEFYTAAESWAKSMQVSKIMVEEWTDVPHDRIKEKLGRIYTMQLSFARV